MKSGPLPFLFDFEIENLEEFHYNNTTFKIQVGLKKLKFFLEYTKSNNYFVSYGKKITIKEKTITDAFKKEHPNLENISKINITDTEFCTTAILNDSQSIDEILKTGFDFSQGILNERQNGIFFRDVIGSLVPISIFYISSINKSKYEIGAYKVSNHILEKSNIEINKTFHPCQFVLGSKLIIRIEEITNLSPARICQINEIKNIKLVKHLEMYDQAKQNETALISYLSKL